MKHRNHQLLLVSLLVRPRFAPHSVQVLSQLHALALAQKTTLAQTPISASGGEADSHPAKKTHSSYYRPAPSFRAFKVVCFAVGNWLAAAYDSTLGALFSHLSWNATLYCALGTAVALIFAACMFSLQAFRRSRGREDLFSILAFGEAQERPSDFHIKDILRRRTQSSKSDSTKESEPESYPVPQRSFLRLDPEQLPRLKLPGKRENTLTNLQDKDFPARRRPRRRSLPLRALHAP